jgi:hypothetical protein
MQGPFKQWKCRPAILVAGLIAALLGAAASIPMPYHRTGPTCSDWKEADYEARLGGPGRLAFGVRGVTPYIVEWVDNRERILIEFSRSGDLIRSHQEGVQGAGRRRTLLTWLCEKLTPTDH